MITAYTNEMQEQVGVFEQLIRLVDGGVALSDIAVIYRKHQQADNLIKALQHRNIPINVKQQVNILEQPLISNLEDIFGFLMMEMERPGQQDGQLFRIMHFRFFDLSLTDLARMAMWRWHEPGASKSLRTMLGDMQLMTGIGIQQTQRMLAFGALINEWLSQIPHITIQMLLQLILTRGKVLNYIMHSDRRSFELQLVASFFSHLKAECRRNPMLDLRGFVELLQDMRQTQIKLPMEHLTRSEEGIHFLTAHGSKGLEFGHVFMIGCNDQHWRARSSGGLFRLPAGIVDTRHGQDQEEERRLFYVGMTRARETLNLSYWSSLPDGRIASPCTFISELEGSTVHSQWATPPTSEVLTFFETVISTPEVSLSQLDHDLIDRKLERLRLSPTSLNLYLRCPRSFYFERILGVPLASSPALGFGNAVHAALESELRGFAEGNPVALAALQTAFERSMARSRAHFTQQQYENLLQHGSVVLPAFVKKQLHEWSNAHALMVEQKFTAVLGDVPLEGKIDLLMRSDDQSATVVDFKTGNRFQRDRKSKMKVFSMDDPKGGEYWRQLVFYHILVREATSKNLHIGVARMDFVEPDDSGIFAVERVTITGEMVMAVERMISLAYEGMINHDFDRGCRRHDCIWCGFVDSDYSVFNDDVHMPSEDWAPLDPATGLLEP